MTISDHHSAAESFMQHLEKEVRKAAQLCLKFICNILYWSDVTSRWLS